IHIDLAHEKELAKALLEAKPGSRQQLGTVLAGLWPKRLADQLLSTVDPSAPDLAARRLADVPDKTLRQLAERIHDWTLVPSGTVGYKKVEVMRGGVDTRALN